MKIGIGIPNCLPATPGSVFTQWAVEAEKAGFSSLSTIGRILFDGHEELIALTACAVVTTTIRLMTTVMIGPARESTLLAKQSATLQAISGGRLTLGLGVGWRRSDFEVTGTDALWENRGDALERQIARLKEVWSDSELGPNPESHPEILLGGAARVALQRAGRLADAFISGPFPREEIVEHFATVDLATGQPKPRKIVPRYFALGKDVKEEMLANVRAYYQAGGEEFVETMQKGVLTTPDQVKKAVQDLETTGADEICFWPQVNSLEQVQRLAQAVF